MPSIPQSFWVLTVNSDTGDIAIDLHTDQDTSQEVVKYTTKDKEFLEAFLKLALDKEVTE